MYNSPFCVRYGLEDRVELLWDYGVSVALHSLFVLRISAHPIGNPIIHSANRIAFTGTSVGLGFPASRLAVWSIIHHPFHIRYCLKYRVKLLGNYRVS